MSLRVPPSESILVSDYITMYITDADTSIIAWHWPVLSQEGKAKASLPWSTSSSSAFALTWRNYSPRSITPPRFL
jgi:hypothetical protein